MSEEYGRRVLSERADMAHSALEDMYAGEIDGSDLEEAFAIISGYIKAADHIGDATEKVSDHIVDATAMIPEGYVIVPLEPTDGMILSGQEYASVLSAGDAHSDECLYRIYKAMIKAAQKEGE